MRVPVKRMPVFVLAVLLLVLSAHAGPLSDPPPQGSNPPQGGNPRPQLRGRPPAPAGSGPGSPPVRQEPNNPSMRGPPPQMEDDDRQMARGERGPPPMNRDGPPTMNRNGPPPKQDDDDDNDDDDRKKPSCDGAPPKKPMDGNNWGQPPPQMGWGQQPPQMGPWGGQGQANWWPPQMGGWGQFPLGFEGEGEGGFGLGGVFGGDFGDLLDGWDLDDFGSFSQLPGQFPPRAPSPSMFIKKMMMIARIKEMMRAAAFAKGFGFPRFGGGFPFPQFGGGPFPGPFGGPGPYPGGPGPYPGGPGPYPGGPSPYPGGPGPYPGGPKPRGKLPPPPCSGPKPKPRPPMLPRPQVCKVQAGNMSISRMPCRMPGTMCSMINQTRCPDVSISICLPRECTEMSMVETKICVLKMIKRKMTEGKRPPPQSTEDVPDFMKGIIDGIRESVDNLVNGDDDEEEDQEMMDIEIAPFLGCFAPDGEFAKFFEEDD